MLTMQNDELLGVLGEESIAGFRLEYLEVYNWGTFHQKVWRIEPHHYNALLTGDIGSGKSTLVDALTTLLVPHHKIVYNKAAGAESKERSLYSYIRGEYKNEKDDSTQMAKAIALRDENNYSVLLANFYNHGLLQNVTLAQVFWLKDNKRNPEKFFIVAMSPLSITQHFSNFGDSISKLKKNLGNIPHVEIFDSFKDYSSKFRQLFGIQNEQALDLFYQTISMKAIGNLTGFVRGHMLEKSEINESLVEIERNFDNLNQAHASILRAKDQIQLLQPIVKLGLEYQVLYAQIEEFTNCINVIDGYFATYAIELYNIQLQKLKQQLEINEQKCKSITERINQLDAEQNKLLFSIEENGGHRLRELEQEIAQLNTERERKYQFAMKYESLVNKLELKYNELEEEFYTNFQAAKEFLVDVEQQLVKLNEQVTILRIEMKAVNDEAGIVTSELNSLKLRTSNIPAKMLKIREELTQTLNLDIELIPFVGELIQVSPNEKEWEGAIERVLHNFGLSLLVADEYYEMISKYVEKTNLRGKLVYYRVKSDTADIKDIDPRSLWHKLLIKPDNRFYSWINEQIQKRFNYICCDNLDDFRRNSIAMTKSGQIKSAGQRHEKDDRYALSDASHYILGWDNKDKIKVLEYQLSGLQRKISKFTEDLLGLNQKNTVMLNRRDICRDLIQFSDFNEINWQAVAKQIDGKLSEKALIESSSNILQDLRDKLQELRSTLNAEKEKFNDEKDRGGGLKVHIENTHNSLFALKECLDGIDQGQQEQVFPILDKIRNEKLKDKVLTTKNINDSKDNLRKHLNAEISKGNRDKNSLNTNVTSKMQIYKTKYPAETSEVDISLEAIPEYILMLHQLELDDLPRHELRFKKLLNEGTINSIVLFQNQLKREENAIKDKIAMINKSLSDIEYNAGTYIVLLADASFDVEIRDFKEKLRNCLSSTIEGSGENTYYNEEKFKQIKELIDRFRGRPDLIEVDKRWTQKVTDVRNWFTFSASERFIEDNVEKEFYFDSSGKSGGQKEKLAYTILASALVYQFGLESGMARSFRFVVIDEAFGKGSDESTRYGLELFKRLHLQLLIITPLQKIRIIEDYINAVHFVHNTNSKNSEVHNLTIAEYKKQQQNMHNSYPNGSTAFIEETIVPTEPLIAIDKAMPVLEIKATHQ
ncbi:MAG: hypothetical protein K0R14_165 [Burkholderiales bacterium]|nr:hypothetical protein [Burkholderiales bacterium]